MAFTAKDVQSLRVSTGAGMMDCKKALEATDGNIEKAVDFLREKGMASAAKKAGRIAAEGICESYIHSGGKIGVLVEVNCETDFVARSDAFKELAHDIALQIAAAKPLYVSSEEIPAEVVEKEKEIAKAQALNEEKPKPLAVIEKFIVPGRVEKFYKEVCLLEQPFVKDQDKTVKQVVSEAVGKIGEKITVRRFVRYEMGEGLEKRSDDLAAEVQSQIAKMKKD